MIPLLEFSAMRSDHGLGQTGPPRHPRGFAMRTIPRRTILKNGVQGAAALTLAGGPARGAAEQRVTVGLIGAGGMGSHHLGLLSALRDVRVAYVCDVDRNRLASAAAVVEKGSGKAPEA